MVLGLVPPREHVNEDPLCVDVPRLLNKAEREIARPVGIRVAHQVPLLHLCTRQIAHGQPMQS
jgi:hypothetical protein